MKAVKMGAHTGWMLIALLAAPLAAAGCGGAKSRLSAEADLGDAGLNGGQAGDQGGTRACGLGKPCDPTNLGRQTCETLGLRAGELSCDPETCFLVLEGCGPGGLSSAPTGTGAGTTQPLPGTTTPLFGGGSGAFGATDGGLFGGGLFGGQPIDGGADEDGGADDPGTGTPGGGGTAPGFFGGGFFGGGFFGGGAGTGGGFFGGGLFGGGAGTGGSGGSG